MKCTQTLQYVEPTECLGRRGPAGIWKRPEETAVSLERPSVWPDPTLVLLRSPGSMGGSSYPSQHRCPVSGREGRGWFLQILASRRQRFLGERWREDHLWVTKAYVDFQGTHTHLEKWQAVSTRNETPRMFGERVSVTLALWLVFVCMSFSIPRNCERTLCCQVREACSPALMPSEVRICFASSGVTWLWCVCHWGRGSQTSVSGEELPVPCMGSAPSVWVSWVLIVPKSVCDILPMVRLSLNRQQNVIPVFQRKTPFQRKQSLILLCWKEEF